MKILVCPKGIIEVVVNGKNHKIVGMSPNAERGYLVVSGKDVEELLKREGYEIFDISIYSGSPENLPSGIKEVIEKHREEIIKEEPPQKVQSESNVSTDIKYGASPNLPTPVFMPAAWTAANNLNYPVTLTYNDTDGKAISFVFTQDYTILPCTWCRFKYWLRNKFQQ